MRLDIVIKLVAEEAYRHGLGYYRTYRSVGKYHYKNPTVCCSFQLEKFNYDIHVFLDKVYKHAFRAGLKRAIPE